MAFTLPDDLPTNWQDDVGMIEDADYLNAVGEMNNSIKDALTALVDGAKSAYVATQESTTSTSYADLAPGRPGATAGLEIALEQFFPDFALDERQQPFSRSLEPRNPAALLAVRRGGETHRAFVIQSMPGVHRVEALGASFALVEAEAERSVTLDVHREPAALLALAGGAVLAMAVLLFGLRSWRASAEAGLR